MDVTNLNEADVFYGRSLECVEIELAIEAGVITSMEQMLAFVRKTRQALDHQRDQAVADAKISQQLRASCLLPQQAPRTSGRPLRPASVRPHSVRVGMARSLIAGNG